ncbi:uncharacterized protein TRAVEDRAFT_53320 [Trametes versicolor FP-101664 SS1]|uniref:uncharacterized protein n=1 Tax=Trametes versicolor (strain FP-101664) TaxID=717944 RepID=UPI0004622FA6|nr:uncharacterized protein TRAVEDRAFT_53320 [Trametes versicolor FP-101664 SS1]EIW52887.1 hypothetical protein TRAVEDRAFT_53320 [Trametes versicolor FP-101664 SS1]
MYRLEDGVVCGVLNDWDLAVDAAVPHSSSVLTGTLHFMAIDLFDARAVRGEVRHLYRHDLEALLWIFLWVMSKHGFLMRKPDHGTTATWTAEAELIRSIRRYLRTAQRARENKNWDMETEDSREEEADEPEKVWWEFCAVVRRVGTAHPAMSYLLALIPDRDSSC